MSITIFKKNRKLRFKEGLSTVLLKRKANSSIRPTEHFRILDTLDDFIINKQIKKLDEKIRTATVINITNTAK